MKEEDKHKTYFLWEEFKKWSTRSFFVILTTLVVALWSPVGNNLRDIWNTPERLGTIEKSIVDLGKNIRTLSGEDRVIRQREGLSYVEEPVHRGDNVFLYLVLERTELGKNCKLTKAVPLFKDKTGVTTPGTRPERPLQSGLGTDPTVIRLEYIPPPNLELGRIEVYVTLEYDCDGRTMFDKTNILTYELLDK